ncbi:lipase member H-A-like isoform X2 [Planococcus citri]|uniref:lipase member H-A-like isoform X2 n=1 Tax=Planococcus citri TaxID=170843 RepID=UPI0031FA2042
MITKCLVFPTFAFLLIINISHSYGYQYGPVIDRILLYSMQYSSFIRAHINATKIRLYLATGTPYPNVPQYPLNFRNVRFYLYTRKNPDIPQILYAGDSKRRLLLAGFDPQLETVIYCHGYNRTFDDSASNFTSSLLPRKDVNIIIVVWDSYTFFDGFYVIFSTIFKLADVIANFVETLIFAGADRKKMNLMGLSDGAQAVALAAKKIHPRVARLTVFDPVGDFFNFLPPTQRVSIGDADYVQIIHCTISKEGLRPQIKGDITFYMNGAIIQPQCANYTDVTIIAYCSHVTCNSYLNESLKKNDTLMGIKCAGFLSRYPKDYDFSDKVILTYDVPTKFKGSYCVNTDYPPPPVF